MPDILLHFANMTEQYLFAKQFAGVTTVFGEVLDISCKPCMVCHLGMVQSKSELS